MSNVINGLRAFNKPKSGGRIMKKLLRLGLGLAIASSGLAPAAQAARQSIIRDSEIEALLRSYTVPIFKAARLNPRSIKVVLVDNRAINAFVTSNNRMFIFTGLLLEAQSPNEVIGVIAHETGHITGAHLSSLQAEMKRASTTQIISMLLGIAATAAGAASGNTNAGNAGIGIMQGGARIARRNFLAYRRVQEASADQAAISYLNKTHQSAKGMVTVFEKLANQMMVTLRYVDPYALSHPVPRQRMALLEERARRSPYYNKKDPPALQLRHDMMRAKLYGFTRGRGATLRKYKASDKSLPARYARAIVSYRSSSIKKAVKQIDELIRSQPGNPYFWELKGQALLESGLARQAIGPLKKAVSLAPNAGLIRIMLAQAMLASGNKTLRKAAITHLRRALLTENDNPDPYRLLARIYGQSGQIALAQLNSAERFLREGNRSLAFTQAARARKKLRKGSPAWLRASDILQLKKLNSRRKR